MQCGPSLSISTSAAWNIAGLSAFLFPEIIEETCVSFSFSGFLLNLLMNDWRFFGLTELFRFLFFVQPLTLPLCKPEGLNDPVPYSTKRLSPFPLLQSNLLSLT